MIKKSFRTSVPTQYKATRQIFHQTAGAKLFYGLFAALAMIVVTVKAVLDNEALVSWSGDTSLWLLMAFLLSFPLIFMPVLQYLLIMKSYKTNPSLQQQQFYEISENGIRNYGEGFNVEMGWSTVPEVLLSKDFLLMFISRSCAYYIPRELIYDEEYQQILNWKKTSAADI